MRLNTLHQRGIKTALVLLIFVIITSFTLAQINNITGAAILIEQKEYTKCLTEKNVELYITENCPKCVAQKDIFEKNFKYINSIDCSDKLTECETLGLTEYPTWIINNQLFIGIYSLNELVEFNECN
ncbi:hypothetical protein HOD61_02605 [archaeon]|jgi:hypothetical protein|nr:hypothetical protein [archaeon]